MKYLKMRNKLISMFILTGLLPLLVLSIYLHNQIEDQMVSDALSENATFFDLKRGIIADFYSERMGDGIVISNIPDVYEGLEIYENYGVHSREWQEDYRDLDHVLHTAVEQYEFLDI
ncbi:hypothetical protein [Evansella tamaricis]|uniref:Sensor histidine kinase n=1 Tax=Evansella tamaricis TaxID=2069301 RepID=A0ABS6JE49_9BACI|nr:hypothetical protein [Evansella tamaricis]MBU9711944.1 hypothetical protein [Evansella tamaricis]